MPKTEKINDVEIIPNLGNLSDPGLHLYMNDLPEDLNELAIEAGIYYKRLAMDLATDCWELGRRLIVLKEQAMHGEFMPLLEKAGIPHSSAQRHMQIARALASVPHFKKLPQQKLLELTSAPAEVIDGEAGTVAGLTPDDVDGMTSAELKKTIRNLRKKMKNSEKQFYDQRRQLDHLKEGTGMSELVNRRMNQVGLGLAAMQELDYDEIETENVLLWINLMHASLDKLNACINPEMQELADIHQGIVPKRKK